MLERHMTETPHRNQNESRLVDHASFLFSCSNSHFQCIVAMLRGAVWVIDVSGCNLEVQSFLCVIHLLSASNVRMKLLTDFACALDVTYWLHTARVAKLFKYFGIMGSWLPGLAQKPAGVPVVLGLVTCQHENWLCQFVVLKIKFLQNVCALFFLPFKRDIRSFMSHGCTLLIEALGAFFHSLWSHLVCLGYFGAAGRPT